MSNKSLNTNKGWYNATGYTNLTYTGTVPALTTKQKVKTMDKRRESHRKQMIAFHNEFQSLLEHALRPEMMRPFCIECKNEGYFTDVISEGLRNNHPYLKPHIERCDSCKVFKNDDEARKYHLTKEQGT